MFVLKLVRFFTRLYGEGKRAAISKSTYIWTLSSRSYIVFALGSEYSKIIFLKNDVHGLVFGRVFFRGDIIQLTLYVCDVTTFHSRTIFPCGT